MLQLQPMTQDEFEAYKVWEVGDYTTAIADNYHLPMDEARTTATKDIDRILNQGLSSPNQFFYNIVLSAEAGEPHIGYLWIDVDVQSKRGFIVDIYLHPEFRHQGWGRKTLELLEADLKQRGITRIILNVFANNPIAQELYLKLGYQPTGISMQKWLTD
jgi:ribosomal protein S18 acetylase RimI-like enzyme